LLDLVRRLHGQIRVGMNGATGIDMVAAFQIGRGLGIPDFLMAEVLPAVEAAAIAAMRSAAKNGE
jgi:hypothetical protein